MMNHMVGKLTHDLSAVGRGQAMVGNFANVVADTMTPALPRIPEGISGVQRDRLRQRMRQGVEEREGEVKWRKGELLQEPSFVAATHALNMLLMPGMANRALDLTKSMAKSTVAPIANAFSGALAGLPRLLQLLISLAAMKQQQEQAASQAALPPAYQNQAPPGWLGPQQQP